jgi:hypothetical protein
LLFLVILIEEVTPLVPSIWKGLAPPEVSLADVVPIKTRSDESIFMAIALASSSIPGDVKDPVNVGLARGAAPDTSDTEIAPSANVLPSEIKLASVLAFVILSLLYGCYVLPQCYAVGYEFVK